MNAEYAQKTPVVSIWVLGIEHKPGLYTELSTRYVYKMLFV